MSATYTEPMDPEEVARRIIEHSEKLESHGKLHEEFAKFMAKWSGGLTVALWSFSIIQVIVMGCVGWAVNSMSKSTEKLNEHTTTLELAKQRLDSFISSGPRFTAEMHAAIDADNQNAIKAWVESKFPPKWLVDEVNRHEEELKHLRNPQK